MVRPSLERMGSWPPGRARIKADSVLSGNMRLMRVNSSPSLCTEFMATTEDTVETEEPKKAKRVRMRRERQTSLSLW